MYLFWRINSTIGLIFGTLSIALLIQEGLDVAISAPLMRLLNYYKAVLDFFLGWADPYLKDIAQHIREYVNIDFHFNPWWKYLFAPMWLYCCAAATTAITAHRSILYAIFYAFTGSAIALVSSLVASIWALDSASAGPVLVIAVGLALFGFGGVVWHTIFLTPPEQSKKWKLVKFSAAYPGGNLLIAVLVSWVSIKLGRIGYFIPSVVQVLAAVSLMALRDLSAGAYGATFERAPLESWRKKFRSYGTSVHGRRETAVICAAILSIVLGRGLERIGL